MWGETNMSLMLIWKNKIHADSLQSNNVRCLRNAAFHFKGLFFLYVNNDIGLSLCSVFIAG